MYGKQPALKGAVSSFKTPSGGLVWALLLLGLAFPATAKEPETAPDRQPLETEDLWESPFFSGIVIEPREFVPQVSVPQVAEPVEREEISFYSDVRNYILQLEEENTHQIYPKETPKKK